MPLIRRWTKQNLAENRENWGSGFYNVQTGQDVSEENLAHADLIIERCKDFGVCNIVPMEAWQDYDAMEAFKNQLDGNYGFLHNQGWMRYFWGDDGKDSMSAGSATPEVLVAAYRRGVIHELAKRFNANQQYWRYEGHSGIPNNVTVQTPPGQITPEVESWFAALAGEGDEVKDIKGRAGVA